MYKNLSALIAFVALFIISHNLYAQTDTADINLGSIHLKKQFTQTVTIKGEDLERYPFTNLADAINVWLYGTNSSQSSLTYMIDGIQVNDVNTYHIHDIEDITLVQNAIAQVSSGAPTRQLVLIHLRKNLAGKSGISASGQTNITNLRETTPEITSTTTFFNNYYLSGYKNTENMHYGASVNYLKDAMPQNPIANKIITNAPGFNRVRLNGYFNASLGKANQLDLTTGYTPQNLGHAETVESGPTSVSNDDQFHQHVFNIALSLKSHLASGFTNQLSAGYNHSNYTDNRNTIILYTGPHSSYNTLVHYNDKNILLYDDLHYTKTVGDFQFEPALNISYHHISRATDSTEIYNQSNVNINTYSEWSKSWLLTPSVSISYKNDLNLIAGVQHGLLSGYYQKNYFPFVSVSVNALHLINEQSTNSLNIYGSYAQSENFVGVANMRDYSSVPYTGTYYNDPVTSLPNALGQPGQIVPSFVVSDFVSSPSDDRIRTITAGATFKLPDNRLVISYIFERRTNPAYLLLPIPGGSTYFPFNASYYAHYLSATCQLMSRESFNWYSGLNASMIKIAYDRPGQYFNTFTAGDHIITGGWVNRINAGNAFAGVDVLYQFGGHTISSTDKINSFSLQNLYAGCHLKLSGIKKLELYASARNLLQNKPSIITDNRRFYGLGFKVDL